MKTIRIGCGAGFWGDNLDAPVILAERGRLDYLVLEYLAELTLSILAHQKARDAGLGYAADFLDVLARLVPHLRAQAGLHVVTNAGGINPHACARKARELLDRAGLGAVQVGVVWGDDLLPRIDELRAAGESFDNLDTGEPFEAIASRLAGANAYLGATGIVEALGRGARVVITGRVADASLTVAPAVHEFAPPLAKGGPAGVESGWAWDAWDRLAAASVAGHLIECGAQATGGLWTNWRRAPRLDDIGYPIVELSADGTFVVTKPDGTGGAVNRETVAEQLVYEIGDPARYMTPDVVVDFTGIELEEVEEDRVAVRGVRGLRAPEHYKVSATYHDGYTAAGMLVVTGPDCVEKARACGELVLRRVERAGYCLAERTVECLGAGDAVPGVLPPPHDLHEVVMRIAVRDPRREAVERFTKELAPLVTSGPPGIAGYAAGRPQVRPVFAYWPTRVSRARVHAAVELDGPDRPRKPRF